MKRKLWTVATSCFVAGVVALIAGVWIDPRFAFTGVVLLGVAVVFSFAAEGARR